MGVTRLPDYTAALVEAGMDPETPVALVERATWSDQRVATGTLETIVDARDEVGIEPPAITVIGGVAGTREETLALLRAGRSRPDPRDGTDPGDTPTEGEGS
jgi:uroporphyrin-III C-methyltransferase